MGEVTITNGMAQSSVGEFYYYDNVSGAKIKMIAATPYIPEDQEMELAHLRQEV